MTQASLVNCNGQAKKAEIAEQKLEEVGGRMSGNTLATSIKTSADGQAAYDMLAATATAKGDAAENNWYWLILEPTDVTEEIVLDTNYVGVVIKHPGTCPNITVDDSAVL